MTTCKCDNCDWTGDQAEAKPLSIAAGLGVRLDPGSVVPAGECPKCGSFAYIWPPTAATVEQGQTAYCIKRISKNGRHTFITGVCFDQAIAEAWLTRCEAETPSANWRIELANIEMRNPYTVKLGERT